MSAVLLQIDPTSAIASTFIERYGVPGAAIVALGLVVLMLWRALENRTEAHMIEIKSCSSERRDELLKKSESDNRLAQAIEGSTQATRAAVDALRATRP